MRPKFNGSFFVIDGTLLGLIRNGDFIDRDYDIDFGMWIDAYEDTLIHSLRSAGFYLLREYGDPENGLVLQFFDGDTHVDIQFYLRTPEAFWTAVYRGKRSIRCAYPPFDLEPAVFQGVDVLVPSPPEQYLETIYGRNWHLPVTAWDYRYGPENARPHGTLSWRASFFIKRTIWRLRNRNIHIRPGDVGGGDTWLEGNPVKGNPRTKSPQKAAVFTDGVFDLLHANHVALLDEARAFGDRLIVGVISDRRAREYKRDPVVSEAERLAVVKSLSSVDEAFILDEPLVAETMERLIKNYQLAAVAYAGDCTPNFYAPAERVGIMHRIPYHLGTSSTGLITRILERSKGGSL